MREPHEPPDASFVDGAIFFVICIAFVMGYLLGTHMTQATGGPP